MEPSWDDVLNFAKQQDEEMDRLLSDPDNVDIIRNELGDEWADALLEGMNK